MMNGFNWEMNWVMWLIPPLIILASYFFVKHISKTKGGQITESPLDILKKRYAKGEVAKEQFEQLKKAI